MRRTKRIYVRCGRCAERYQPYRTCYDVWPGICKSCHVKELRKQAADIERLKAEVRGSLSTDEKKREWDGWTSQRKKLFVFQAMEAGHITWEIKKQPITNLLYNSFI